jgi:hypothetical protein
VAKLDPIQLAKWAKDFFAVLQDGADEPLLTYWQEYFWFWEDGIYVPIPPEVMQDKILVWLTAQGYSAIPDHAHGVMINLRAMVRAPMSTEINTWLRPPGDLDGLDDQPEQRPAGCDDTETIEALT